MSKESVRSSIHKNSWIREFQADFDKLIALRKKEAMKLMIFNIGLENELLKLYIKSALELECLNENEAEINEWQCNVIRIHLWTILCERIPIVNK